jgi:hypothetical protein
MRRRIPLLLASALLASACSRRAASTQPQALPMPLVSALMGQGESRKLQYTVGSLPAAFPTVLRPPATVTIVGGMERGQQVIGVFADSSRPLAVVFENLFEQAGLKRQIERRPSGFSGRFGATGQFCNDTSFAFVNSTAEPNVVSVSYYRGRGMTCGEDSAVGPDLEIPPLTPPPGVRVPSSGGGSGSRGVDARAEMTGTNLKTGPILGHYSAQLVAAGWKADPPAISEHVSAQFFEARTATGQVWIGTMIITGTDTALSLTINMHPRTR